MPTSAGSVNDYDVLKQCCNSLYICHCMGPKRNPGHKKGTVQCIRQILKQTIRSVVEWVIKISFWCVCRKDKSVIHVVKRFQIVLRVLEMTQISPRLKI
jgi:hypothetical protein